MLLNVIHMIIYYNIAFMKIMAKETNAATHILNTPGKNDSNSFENQVTTVVCCGI